MFCVMVLNLNLALNLPLNLNLVLKCFRLVFHHRKAF